MATKNTKTVQNSKLLRVITEHPAYRINESGDVFNKSGKKLATRLNNKGYVIITLTTGGRKDRLVSRLVAEAFKPNPKKLSCVCHKDNDPLNNHYSNLYWGSYSDNSKQALRDGRLTQIIKKGENRNNKLPLTEVLYIRKNYMQHKIEDLSTFCKVKVSTIMSIIDNRSYKSKIYQI